jgi:hypothetical protein
MTKEAMVHATGQEFGVVRINLGLASSFKDVWNVLQRYWITRLDYGIAGDFLRRLATIHSIAILLAVTRSIIIIRPNFPSSIVHWEPNPLITAMR